MLIPLTRKTFESLIPSVSTGSQYLYCWGKAQDFLRRLLYSVFGLVIVTFGGMLLFGRGYGFFRFFLGLAAGLYWLWWPAVQASLRNRGYRQYAYSGLWQGRVLDVYVTEDLVGTEETVNNRGELVVVENRERRINLQVGDRSGFTTMIQAPLKREHKSIKPGQTAKLVVLSQDRNLARIAKVTDVYIVERDVWVSDYPYLEREAFRGVSRRLDSQAGDRYDTPVRQRGRTYRDPDDYRDDDRFDDTDYQDDQPYAEQPYREPYRKRPLDVRYVSPNPSARRRRPSEPDDAPPRRSRHQPPINQDDYGRES